MKRAAFIPIAGALLISTILTAFCSYLALDAEFQDAKWIVESHPPLPPPTALLRAVYPFVWLLPVATFFAAFLLLRCESISSTQAAWFGSSVGLALFSWLLLIAVAFFLVYSQDGHYVRPISVH